jgi:hypothetical protein
MSVTKPHAAVTLEIEDDGLEREQQRAEGPRQQHEGEHGDERDHQREAAVDRGDEVRVLSTLAADLGARSGRVGPVLRERERGPTGGGRGIGDRHRVDDRGSCPAPLG